jgi:hypothetical protein
VALALAVLAAVGLAIWMLFRKPENFTPKAGCKGPPRTGAPSPRAIEIEQPRRAARKLSEVR